VDATILGMLSAMRKLTSHFESRLLKTISDHRCEITGDWPPPDYFRLAVTRDLGLVWGNSGVGSVTLASVPPVSAQISGSFRQRHAEESDLRANTFTPCTPYLRAVFSLDVVRKQSNRAVIWTSSRPVCDRYATSSASGRAPAIQPVHKSMLRRASSGSSTAMRKLTTRSSKAVCLRPWAITGVKSQVWNFGLVC